MNNRLKHTVPHGIVLGEKMANEEESGVNVDNSSALIFRCSPQKIIEITLAFDLNNNKNVCKTFVHTKNHENM